MSGLPPPKRPGYLALIDLRKQVPMGVEIVVWLMERIEAERPIHTAALTRVFPMRRDTAVGIVHGPWVKWARYQVHQERGPSWETASPSPQEKWGKALREYVGDHRGEGPEPAPGTPAVGEEK